MIYLRNLTIDDFDYLNSVENNKTFWKYSFQNKNYSKEDLIQFIYDSQLPLEQTNQIRFVICKTETDEPLGFIDLFKILSISSAKIDGPYFFFTMLAGT